MVPGGLRPEQDEGAAVRWWNGEDEGISEGTQKKNLNFVWKKNVDAVPSSATSTDRRTVTEHLRVKCCHLMNVDDGTRSEIFLSS